MTTPPPADAGNAAGDADVERDLLAAERWFVDHGLPYFLGRGDQGRWLSAERLRPAALATALLAGAVGGLTVAAVRLWSWDPLAPGGTPARDAGWSVAAGVVAAGAVVLLAVLWYLGGPLRLATMTRWASGRVVGQLNLLLPLVTRALPLLLLFMTFLFINTEVWQVASSLSRPALYSVVLLFAVVAVAFLLTRLPEEVRAVERAVGAEGVRRNCEGTPLQERACSWAPDEPVEPLTRRQRVNLVLVLLVTQALQVLLLAVAVLAFFLLFGVVAVDDSVVEAWVGRPPDPLVWFGQELPAAVPVSDQLYQVSVFLSSFAALYFTVYAVSDATYRTQFFTRISRELEQAVGVRAVYHALLRRRSEPGPVPPPA